MRTNPANGSYRVKTLVFQVWNPDTGLYHAVYPLGPEGAVALRCAAGDASAADADADMTTSPANGTWRSKTKVFQLWNAETAKYHAIYPYGPENAVRTVIAAGDAAAADADAAMPANDADSSVRVVNGILQFWNPVTGKYHALWLSGPAGAVREVWGAGQN